MLLLQCFVVLLGTVGAQEFPFAQLAKFEDAAFRFRTNVCDRQKALLEGSLDLRHALQGLNLTVAITNYVGVPNEEYLFALEPPLNQIPVKDPGLFAVLLDELAVRAGFTWRNTFVAVDPLTTVESEEFGKSWTDLLEWEVTNFDIAADYWARSVERMARGISFPHGWYDGSIVFATSLATEEEKFNYWSFLVPFTTQVWLAIAVVTLITGFMYMMLERMNHRADERELENKPLGSLFLAALTFTGHFQYKPDTNAARLLSFSWTFWSLIMVSAYTANMASFLVSKNELIEHISTIEDALRTGTPVCVQRGAVIDELLSDKYPELKLVRKSKESEMFTGLTQGWYGGSGGCGVLLTNLGTYDIYQRQQDTNRDCSLTSDKRVILNLPAGFATAVDSAVLCTSLISYVLDLHLSEMERDGFISQAWQNHLQKISQHDCTGKGPDFSDQPDSSLSLKDMGGIFLTHAGLSVLAVTMAVFQFFWAKHHRVEDRSVRSLLFTSLRLDLAAARQKNPKPHSTGTRLTSKSE